MSAANLKFHISVRKTKYLESSYFPDIVNKVVNINHKKLLWIAKHICKIEKSRYHLLNHKSGEICDILKVLVRTFLLHHLESGRFIFSRV